MQRKKSPSHGIPAAKKLVCVVEGHGEVEAIPCLCSRILQKLEAWTWHVDSDPIRMPRSQLAKEHGLDRAATLAFRSRNASAVLVICDADDDCPADWNARAMRVLRGYGGGGAVMAMREYESWLLCSVLRQSRIGNRSVEDIRDAKGRLEQFVRGYLPTIHQLQLTRNLQIDTVWSLSASFDKLIRTLGTISGAAPGTRPLPLDGT